MHRKFLMRTCMVVDEWCFRAMRVLRWLCSIATHLFHHSTFALAIRNMSSFSVYFIHYFCTFKMMLAFSCFCFDFYTEFLSKYDNPMEEIFRSSVAKRMRIRDREHKILHSQFITANGNRLHFCITDLSHGPWVVVHRYNFDCTFNILPCTSTFLHMNRKKKRKPKRRSTLPPNRNGHVIQSYDHIERIFSCDYFVQERKSTFNIFQGCYRNK